MILSPTFVASIHELATGHRNKGTFGTADDLEIAHHKIIVEGDAAKGLQFFILVADQFDAYFRNFHDNPLASTA